jgi:AAA domain
VAGAQALPEEEIDGLDEARARGVREALLFYDRDKAGLGFKTGMISRCIAAKIDSTPVDIRPLIDVYGGGNKDARDLLGLFDGNAEALRAALDDAIARADARLDVLFPLHDGAIQGVTVDWIIEGLLARNQITFVSSAPGRGKTTIIHAYCVVARDGGDFFGRRVEPHKVLLVTEEGRVSLAAKALTYGGFPNVRVHSIDDGPFASDVWDDRLRIIKRAAQRFGATTVVLDTFLSFCLAEDEDRAATLRPLLNQVRYLATDGIGVLGTFHDTKAGSPFAGSGTIKGQCDVAIALRPSPDLDPTHRGLDFIKNRLCHDLDKKTFTVTMDGTRFVIVDPVPPRASASPSSSGAPGSSPDDAGAGQTVQLRLPLSATERNGRAVLAAAAEEWQARRTLEEASGVRGGSFTRASGALVKEGLLELEQRQESESGHPVKKNYYRKPPASSPTESEDARGGDMTDAAEEATDA